MTASILAKIRVKISSLTILRLLVVASQAHALLLVCGQSVVLVEKLVDLGGNVNTQADPAKGTTINYGAQAF